MRLLHEIRVILSESKYTPGVCSTHPVWRNLRVLLFILFLFFVTHKQIYAAVVINEIMPHPSAGADWIEIYNSEDADISGFILEDSTSQIHTFEQGAKFSSSSAYILVFKSNRLNNGGDTIRLKSNSGEVIDEKIYTEDPGVGVSLGRYPDGGEKWGILSSSSPESLNATIVSYSPTPSVTPTNTPTPKSVATARVTSTPKPTATPKSSDAKISSTPTEVMEDKTLSLSPSVLGQQDDSAQESSLQSDLQETATSASKKSNLTLFLLVPGSFLLFAGIFLSFRQTRKYKSLK